MSKGNETLTTHPHRHFIEMRCEMGDWWYIYHHHMSNASSWLKGDTNFQLSYKKLPLN